MLGSFIITAVFLFLTSSNHRSYWMISSLPSLHCIKERVALQMELKPTETTFKMALGVLL